MTSESDVHDPPRAAPAEVILSRSPEETFQLGVRMSQQLSPGSVLLLKGELGAGKTLLVKGLAGGVGIDPRDVTSPTFALINEYHGRTRLYHVDLYRLDYGLPELGLEEILERGDAIVAIEWAERLAYVPPNATEVEIVWVSEQEREIRISRPKPS
ncbi:MAG TPA: tRNA (adenosine(37)-N6)-threonylcarbamoyltransferase complex ATPase subunit type 1 TsaE [Blastocatellia bacterium]|nr:tRNA (adenosine(37)-N6)-threonylcarbamoyltransferase complex ATPase subunit type 1 TsaE [Blastocatellia bacterium]